MVIHTSFVVALCSIFLRLASSDLVDVVGESQPEKQRFIPPGQAYINNHHEKELLLFYEPEHVVGRHDKWTRDTGDCVAINSSCRTDSAPILQIVTSRDVILGCNSFEEYLSPRFHTMFVLPHDFAMAMKMDEFVDNLSSEQTAGAHLFLLAGETGGEVLARRLGIQFLEKELEPREDIRIQYLVSVNCDVHPLPPDHDMYVPFDEVVFRMMEYMQLSQEYRRRGSYLETNYDDPYTREYRGQMKEILAINTLLFHDAQDRTTLNWLHGKDIFHWWKDAWRNKPEHLVEEGLPWLIDNSLNFEDHMVLYDLELLRRIKDDFLVYPMHFIEADGLVGRLANKYNMTVIRSHDLRLYLNFGLRPDELDFPSHVDLDWMKARNVNMLAAFRNPREVADNWGLALEKSGIEDPKGQADGAATFLCNFLNPSTWIPSTFHRGARIGQEPYNRMMLSGFLRCLGYVQSSNITDNSTMLEFHLDGSFYGNRILKISDSTVNEQVDWSKWTRLLTFRHQGGVFSLLLCGYEVEECNSFAQSRLSMEERTLLFPLDAVLEDLTLNSNCDLWGSWHHNALHAPGDGGMA